MSSYDQGRMDAWERIDALKRRLGLLGFFNEQKHKRYPKGHPKAGQFMDLPDNPIKARVSKEKKFVVDIEEEKSTRINGHEFTLAIESGLAQSEFSSPSRGLKIVFQANGSTVMDESIDPVTAKKAALWWRREAVSQAKKLPNGTMLSCLAEDRDGRGADRTSFYEALGFKSGAFGQMYSSVRNGKLTPIPITESDIAKAPKSFIVTKKSLEFIDLKKLSKRSPLSRQIESAERNVSKYEKEVSKQEEIASRNSNIDDKVARFAAERSQRYADEAKVKAGLARAEVKTLLGKIEKNRADKDRLKAKRDKQPTAKI